MHWVVCQPKLQIRLTPLAVLLQILEQCSLLRSYSHRSNGTTAIRRSANQNQANVQAPFGRPPNVIAAPGGILHEHEDLESLTTATNHIIMLSEDSSQHWHDTCVREHLFPNQKFLVLKTDLDFSNRAGSVCRRMAAKCHVPDHEVEVWWNTAKKTVNTTLKLHRNNVIKSIKTTFVGKFNSVLAASVRWLFISLWCLDQPSMLHCRSIRHYARSTRCSTTHLH